MKCRALDADGNRASQGPYTIVLTVSSLRFSFACRIVNTVVHQGLYQSGCFWWFVMGLGWLYVFTALTQAIVAGAVSAQVTMLTSSHAHTLLLSAIFVPMLLHFWFYHRAILTCCFSHWPATHLTHLSMRCCLSHEFLPTWFPHHIES